MRLATRLHTGVAAAALALMGGAFLCFDRPAAVVVQRAGTEAANGVYLRQRGSTFAKVEPRSSRVPGLFTDLSTTFRAGAERVMGSGTVWAVVRGEDELYAADASGDSSLPPDGGWKALAGSGPSPSLSVQSPLLASPAELSRTNRRSVWARSPALRDLATRPVNSFIMLLCGVLYVYIWSQRLGYPDVGMSYALVVLRKQYWRVVSASLAHVDFFHIAMNMASLYGLGELEQAIGSLRYLQLSVQLLFLSMLSALAISHGAAVYGGRPRNVHTLAVGYSCVLFGLMVVTAIKTDKYCAIPGVKALCFTTYRIPLPDGLPALALNAAPFAMLLLVQLILRRASFIGHLSGTLMGYPLAWGALAWCGPATLGRLLLAAALGWQAYLDSSGMRARLEEMAREQGAEGTPSFAVTRPRGLADTEVALLGRFRHRFLCPLALAAPAAAALCVMGAVAAAVNTVLAVLGLAYLTHRVRGATTSESAWAWALRPSGPPGAITDAIPHPEMAELQGLLAAFLALSAVDAAEAAVTLGQLAARGHVWFAAGLANVPWAVAATSMMAVAALDTLRGCADMLWCVSGGTHLRLTPPRVTPRPPPSTAARPRRDGRCCRGRPSSGTRWSARPTASMC